MINFCKKVTLTLIIVSLSLKTNASVECPPCQEAKYEDSHASKKECVPIPDGENPDGDGCCIDGELVSDEILCCNKEGERNSDKDAKKNGSDPAVATVTCCDGEPHVNVNDNADDQLNDDEATAAYKACKGVHERHHKEECEKVDCCKGKEDGHNVGPDDTGKTKGEAYREEADAHEKEEDCLRDQKDKCTTGKCEDELERGIQDAKRKKEDNDAAASSRGR